MSEKNEKDYIEVAVAIIRSGDHFLLAKRPKGKTFAGKWEFPGGKIEPRELPDSCLIREIHEELGIAIMVKEPFVIWDYEYKYPNSRKFRFHSYLCEILEGEPQSLWHEEISWVKIDDVKTLDLLEADKELIPLIEKKFIMKSP